MKRCVLKTVLLVVFLAVTFHATAACTSAGQRIRLVGGRLGHLGKTTDEILRQTNTAPANFRCVAVPDSLKRDLRGENGLSTVEKRLLVLARFDSAINKDEFKRYFQKEKANEASAALDALKEIHAIVTPFEPPLTQIVRPVICALRESNS
jgi:hypothetical protein